MFSTSSAVKTLRAYYKDKLTLADPTKFAEELLNESDRAAIILNGTVLDDALIYGITQHLAVERDKQTIDYIFRFDGPLGSFSSRIELSYFLGRVDGFYQDKGAGE